MPNNIDIIRMCDALAKEKDIERSVVVEAMEEAIAKAASLKYGQEHDIRAEINQQNGEITIRRFREVVEEGQVEDPKTQLLLEDAVKYNKDVEIGNFVVDILPPVQFGRVAAQQARNIVTQRIKDAERSKQYEEFKDKQGHVVMGTVKRTDYGSLVVDLGRGEAVLKRNELIPREIFRVGDTIKAYIYSVRSGGDGPTVLLSRTHPQFMAKLFEQEVPEIYDGTISIKSVARDPGSRGKICVHTDDVSIDPVGSCVGVRGSRVQAIVNELRGEKIDIIQWKEDFASLVVSSLTPAEINKVVLDEDDNRVEVVVPQEFLSKAIGRSGQNVRLASILLGMDIDIITEEQDAEKRAEELKKYISIFREQLDVDDVIAGLLVTEGFSSLDEIVEAGIDELKSIDSFNENIANEIFSRAEEYLSKQEQNLISKQEELGFDESLYETGLDANEIILLAENGIKNLEDLADLASDELLEIIGEKALTSEEADSLIMAARSLFIDFGDNNKTDEVDNQEQEDSTNNDS